ncbi:hypothetical protein TSUD_348370 [Trifolium subterraneum]|nr:hypothetical protein TSUD_348370 [Trifolium subterraneum]
MSDTSDNNNNNLGDSPAVDITGKIMVVVIIVLFMTVVSFLFVHLFAKGFWWSQRRQRHSDNNSQSQRGQRRRDGLDASVLKSLPVSVFNSKEEDGLDLECSVCLSEVVEGEKLRVLPQCNHRFHIDCIDMWFQSHSTCPLCRTTLATATPPPTTLVVQEEESSAAAFPTNVLIWGNHNQVISSTTTLEQNISSSSSNINNNNTNGMLTIDIPNDCDCEATASSSSPLGTAGGRLNSLKRLLSSRALSSLNPWSPTSSSSSTTQHVQQQSKPKEAPGQS